MSKGPGRIERMLIGIFFDTKLDNAFTTEELSERIYGDSAAKKHRVAIIRAAKRLSKRNGCEDLHSWRSDYLGKTHIWFNRANVMSYAMAALKADSTHDYRSRDQRRVWGTPDWHKEESKLRALLRRGGAKKVYGKYHKYQRGYYRNIAPGGAWYGDVQAWITERDLRRAGDKKRLEAFLAAQKAKEEAEMAKLVAAFKAASGTS